MALKIAPDRDLRQALMCGHLGRTPDSILYTQIWKDVAFTDEERGIYPRVTLVAGLNAQVSKKVLIAIMSPRTVSALKSASIFSE